MLPYIPKVLVNMILEYDGRIKYKYTKGRYEDGVYVNIISKNDPRYTLLENIIIRKQEIIASTDYSIDGRGFYFDITLNSYPRMSLCYDYNWSRSSVCEICLSTIKNDLKQIRTIVN